MFRFDSRRLVLLGSLAIFVAVPVAEAAVHRFAKTVAIASLPKARQKFLRAGGVKGNVLRLVGVPQTIAIYSAPSVNGTCMMADHGRGIGGADCDPAALKPGKPGMITVLYKTPVGPDGYPSTDDSKKQMLSAYGMATPNVAAVRIRSADGSLTEVPIVKARGFVAFGTDAPPTNGRSVELLDAAGKVLEAGS